MSYSLLGSIIFVLDLFAIFSLLVGYGSTGHKVFWVVMILLLPVIGMLLYYLIGRSQVDA